MSRIVALSNITGSDYAAVDGMVLSTANLYFTTHDRDFTKVFRTAQSAQPGQEVELCREQSCRFGDIVFAKVDDLFYGYFFALAGGITTIKRIPLAPQPGQVAEIIGPPIADIDIVSSYGNLVTDGSFLYWQSDNAINKMPVGGGAVTVLDTTLSLTRPVTGLHLVGPNLIYAVGRVVYHVPVDGSASQTPPASRVVFTTGTGVAACAPQVGSVYVADRNGAIVWHSDNGSSQVKQDHGAGFITSMALDVSHAAVAWTQMAANWQVRVEAGVNNLTLPAGANPRLAMFNAAGDVFWIDDDGVKASR